VVGFIESTTLARELLRRGVDDEAPAVIERGRATSRTELLTRVDRRVGELDLAERSIVVLSGTNSLEFVVTYLALIDAGHVPLLAAGYVPELAAAWSPAATVHVDRDDVQFVRRDVAPQELHPDLALLLSTSGSTGSPKLVRLSNSNLVSNARAIGEYLGLTGADRGITSLPLHYCYGLSVLHSHLCAGAGVVVTDASVVDACFRDAMRTYGVTNVAGVPHTFEMLERAGPDALRVPSLRFLTQAGGRLDPEAVVRWSERAHGWGVEFFVMYGQTEATARMAYLPPELTRRRPTAIGRPIPGGHLELRPTEGLPDDVGELVYRGPNVMMGYACVPADLAAGRTIDELPTGDLARFHADDGVYEIVGRRSRFVKPYGLRIDLDDVERHLRLVDVLVGEAPDVAVTGDDHRIVVAAPGADAIAVAREVGQLTGLPPTSMVIHVDGTIPRTASGKVDYDALSRREAPAIGDPNPVEAVDSNRIESIGAIYADTLGCVAVDANDSFVSLGGDSLSYIECSIRLERVLGRLPQDWHQRPIAELAGSAHRPRRIARVDTTVLLRAVGICAIVGTHMQLVYMLGGSHMLLAVVGYNIARFMLPIESRRERVRAGLRTAARAAIPTITWVAGAMLLAGAYGAGTLMLVNNYVGPESHSGDQWHFWFIEVFVHVVLLTTAFMAISPLHRLDRRFPWGLPLAVFLAALLLRLDWAQVGDWYNVRFRTHGVAWFFVLGWLVQRSSRWWQRLVTSGACVVFIPGFFHYAPREWFIAGSLLVLLWFRELPFPRHLIRPVGVLATASLWIYVTHFMIWPPLLERMNAELALVATIAAGVTIWAVTDRFVRWAPRRVRSSTAALADWRRRHVAPVVEDTASRAMA
jgi:acyl-CoA synthetase (AMP-forming)/AMP-acid ligase II